MNPLKKGTNILVKDIKRFDCNLTKLKIMKIRVFLALN